ncbi:MAG: ABC transporter permease [Gammaproteobacteria bacterium]
MIVIRHGLRSVLRDIRSGELLVLVAAITLAVAATTAVGFFTDRVGKAVVIRSAEVLAADLVLRSNRPIRPDYLVEAESLDLRSAAMTSFASVVLTDDASALADIEAAGPGYPLRGELRTSLVPYGDTRIEKSLPASGEAWADPRLLARLGVEPGATVGVGSTTLLITRVLDYRPDQDWSFVDLAPTLLINIDDVDATGLVQPGSRVTYRQLFAGDPSDIRTLRQFIEPQLGVSERLRDLSDAGPQIRNALQRAERFLALAALAGALLAAVAVAMAGRRYAIRQTDTVALMKCIGVGKNFVLGVGLVQLLGIGIVAGMAGVAAGFVAQFGLAVLLSGIAGGALPAPGPGPAVTGMGLSLLILAGFALPTWLQLRHVPPLRVLRRDVGPPPSSALLVYGLAVLTVLLVLYNQARDASLVMWMAGGIIVGAILLGVAGGALVWLGTRVRGSAGVAWRYAVSGIARRGWESVLQVAAFGVGIMVLLLLTLIRADLMAEWQASLPRDAPNRFLINIQPEEAKDVEDFLATRVAEASLVPMVRARLVEIDGASISEMQFQSERGRRLADREANLSWSETPREDNEVVKGTWWGPESAAGEVSVEVEFASDLGVELGDQLTFDIAGEQVNARVTNLRTVNWESFMPNFFMVFSPGTLDDYPRTHIGSVYIRDDQKGAVLDLIKRFPSVTVIDIDAVLGQVRGVMDQAAQAVEYVFLFALAAGLMVLLAVVESGREVRLFECAVLRTLGARRQQVLNAAAIEFTMLGFLSGLLAAVGASIIGSLVASEVFELDLTISPWIWIAGVASGVVIVGATGFLATRRVVDHPPREALRNF